MRCRTLDHLPFPVATKFLSDTSLGMPTLIMQCQDWTKDVVFVAPEPYDTAEWMNPPWMK